jgi:hypothetical protein
VLAPLHAIGLECAHGSSPFGFDPAPIAAEQLPVIRASNSVAAVLRIAAEGRNPSPEINLLRARSSSDGPCDRGNPRPRLPRRAMDSQGRMDRWTP